MFYPEPQPRMQGICQPSDRPFWGLVSHSFYTTDEAHIAAQGPVFFPIFRIFSCLLCAWLLLLLTPEGPGGTQASAKSFVWLAVSSCPHRCLSRFVRPVTEPSPLAAPSPWQSQRTRGSSAPSTDSPAVLGERSLYGRYIAESIFHFLFSSPFQYFPNLHSSHEHVFLAFAGWGF